MKNPRLRRALAVLTAVCLALPALIVVSPTSMAEAQEPVRPATAYTADALPTAQINGVVWDQAVVGTTVYATGEFTRARPAGSPAGSDETTVSNLVAYDLTTGELLGAPMPQFNGAGYALAVSDDGQTLYVAGAFDQVDGAWHNSLVALDVSSGAPVVMESFKPVFNTAVRAVDVVGDVVYAGGYFTAVNGVTRNELAAVDATTGATLDWTASATGTNAQVRALRVSPDGSKVVVGGSFSQINGSSNPGYGLALLDAVTGAVLPTPVNSAVRNAGQWGAILDIAVDEGGFYGAGYSQSRSQANLEGVFKADWDGNELWIEPCHGDSYSVVPSGGEVYVVNHAHSCETIGGFADTKVTVNGVTQTRYYSGMAFTNSSDIAIRKQGTGQYQDWTGHSSPDILDWYTDLAQGTYTGQYQAAYDIALTDDYVLLAGEFTSADGRPQQGLVRYPRRGLTTSHVPEGDASDLGLTVAAGSGVVTASFTPTWDRDDTTLSYSLLRDDDPNPVAALEVSDRHWESQTTRTLRDLGASAGTHLYRLQVTDPGGNTLTTDPVSVDVDGDGPGEHAMGALNLGAAHLWTMEESSGTTLADLAGNAPMQINSSVTVGAEGARDGSHAISLRSGASATTSSSDGDIQPFTVEAWIRTSSTSAGSIISYRSGSTVDRLLYLDSDGYVRLGVNTGQIRTVRSGAAVNDGIWHHIAASLGADGAMIYVDGSPSGSDATITTARSFSGMWTLGGTITGWPGATNGAGGWWNRASVSAVVGDIDDLAVYPKALSAEEIASRVAPVADGDTPVDPADPAEPVAARILVEDTFSREVVSGWGQADTGEAWQLPSWRPSSVDGSAGVIGLDQPGWTTTAVLPAVSTTSAEVTATLTLNEQPTGGGIYTTVLARRTDMGYYGVKIVTGSGGHVSAVLTAVSGGDEKALASAYITGGWTPETPINVTVSATGIDTTTLQATVWTGAGTAPQEPTLVATDDTEALQAAGTVGIQTYLSGSATSTTGELRVDSFSARDLQL